MSSYVFYLSSGAKLSVDTSFIDHDGEVQSEDFSVVFGEYVDTTPARTDIEIFGELIVGLAGTVH